MSIADYEVLMDAAFEREEKKGKEMHMQAWLNQRVGDTNKRGEYIYRTFSKFYKAGNKSTPIKTNVTQMVYYKELATRFAEVNRTKGR